MLQVRRAIESDVLLIAPRLRAEDVAEAAAAGRTPLQALAIAYFESSRCFTVTIDDSPEALFGVVPCGSFGSVWLLGTPVTFAEEKQEFLRQSRHWMQQLAAGFDHIGNCVDARNTVHIRWLEWLGFEMQSPILLAPHGLPFIPFTLHV